MTRPTSDVAFTPTVKALQERFGSRRGYASMEARGGWESTVTPELSAFVAELDSIYLATVSSEGYPYVQHRGGPKGFVKVLDDRTLAFAEFDGNRQFLSMGNLQGDDRAFLFLMDHANRRRVKVWGRAEFVEFDESSDPGLAEKLVDPGYGAKAVRALLFRVEAWDVNCPRHITPRFTTAEIGAVVDPLRQRIAALEAENAALRARLDT